MRVTRSSELVAQGFALATVARVAQMSRQAIYRTPKIRPAKARRQESQEVRRYDDRPRGLLVGMEASLMIQTRRSLTEEEHRKRVAAASAWAVEQ